MAHQLFQLPKAQPLTSAGRVLPGSKLSFFLTTTSTPTPVYTTSALNVAHTQPLVADAGGRFAEIYLDPTIAYKATVTDANDVLLYTVDPVNDQILSQAAIGQLLYPRTAAEISAGVTPSDYAYPQGYVERYGAVGDGVTDDTAAIQRAIDVLEAVYFLGKTYLAHGLTQSEDFQRFYGTGDTRIQKNQNGTLFSSTGDDVEFNGIGFRSGAAAADYTGDNFVATGENVRLLNCGSRYTSGRAVKITGNHAQIIGTCDKYQTTDATGSGYDIEIGVSGTATLYHSITDIYTSIPTGGILLIDTGSAKVSSSQFGKLTVQNGTGPVGVNGGNYIGNRILGDIAVGVSSSVFAGNTIGVVAVSFAGGTSGHRFDRSNQLQSGATLTDSSTASVVEDSRLVPFQSFTPVFTAAGGSPDVGNGSLIGRFSQQGRQVKGFIRFIIGSSTNAGTGAWFFSLPAIPNTTMNCHDDLTIFDTGTDFKLHQTRTLTDGTARIQGVINGSGSLLGAANPITPATGDEYHLAFDYFTN